MPFDIKDAEPDAEQLAPGCNSPHIAEAAENRVFTKERKGQCYRETTDQLKAGVRGANAMRGHVARMLVGQDRADWENRQDAGRFDPKASPRASWGALDVYRRPITEDRPTAALSILVDQSGSMGGELGKTPKCRAAAAMAVNLSDAADAAACPVEVAGFNSNKTVTQYRAFGQPRRECREQLAGVANRGGGTRFSPALLAAAQRLANTPADRRVLVALVDGDCGHGASAVEYAVEQTRAFGVVLVAVILTSRGSDPRKIAGLFGLAGANAVQVINDGKEVTHKVFAEIAKTLEAGAV